MKNSKYTFEEMRIIVNSSDVKNTKMKQELLKIIDMVEELEQWVKQWRTCYEA